jgi:hypothetical protein
MLASLGMDSTGGGCNAGADRGDVSTGMHIFLKTSEHPRRNTHTHTQGTGTHSQPQHALQVRFQAVSGDVAHVLGQQQGRRQDCPRVELKPASNVRAKARTAGEGHGAEAVPAQGARRKPVARVRASAPLDTPSTPCSPHAAQNTISAPLTVRPACSATTAPSHLDCSSVTASTLA